MSKKMRDSRASIFTLRKHFGSFPFDDYHWHLSGQVCAMWQGNLGNTGGKGGGCCFLLFLFIFFFFSLAICHPQKTNWCFINKDEGENESALGNWQSVTASSGGRQTEISRLCVKQLSLPSFSACFLGNLRAYQKKTGVIWKPPGRDPYSLLNVNSWMKVKWKSHGRVQLFVTPWTIQSMGFSRPEYWSR